MNAKLINTGRANRQWKENLLKVENMKEKE
jgi:hypothetical protein